MEKLVVKEVFLFFCSTCLWHPFSGLILASQFTLQLFKMFSMYIVLLKCNHLEVIFFDTMDRNRNNVFLRRQMILNIYKIRNIYFIFKFASFVLQEISIRVKLSWVVTRLNRKSLCNKLVMLFIFLSV